MITMGGSRMGNGAARAILLLMVISSMFLAGVLGYKGRGRRGEGEEGEEWPYGYGEREEEGRRAREGRLFMLEESTPVVKGEGGEVRVVKGPRWMRDGSPLDMGFISMEPNTLFIPQYLDTSLILFIRRGEAKVGWIHKDQMVEKQLKMGDINRIPAGMAFYIVNTGKGQRLQIICSIDTSESLGFDSYQPFYIAGGLNPTSVLSGFGFSTLTTAFNVSSEELGKIMTRRTEGPIVFVTGEAAEQPHRMMKSRLEEVQKKAKAYYDDDEDDEADGEEEGTSWSSWRWLMKALLGREDNGRLAGVRKGKGPVRAPDPYNLYDRDPDFRNDYGWSLALDKHDYAPLKKSGVGVYLVNLTAGSMMAPHVNPTATEYGIVLGGSGTVQVVYPNGTAAMNAEVREGDVFWVPRYFPFCQIASRGGPLEFFGFTTSARRNRPQFLVGASSILTAMAGPELAVGFGVSEDRLRSMVAAQRESVILPSWPVPKKGREGEEEPPLLIRKVMG